MLKTMPLEIKLIFNALDLFKSLIQMDPAFFVSRSLHYDLLLAAASMTLDSIWSLADEVCSH